MQMRFAPVILLMVSTSVQAGGGVVRSGRVCSKDPAHHGHFVKILEYSDSSIRIEECVLSGVDDTSCKDIKGYHPKGYTMQGNPALTLKSSIFNRRRALVEFKSMLTLNLKKLAKFSAESTALAYLQSTLQPSVPSRDCNFFEGDYVQWVDDLRSALGQLPTQENLNAKADFLRQVYNLEREHRSVSDRNLSGGVLWYSRAKGGDWYIGKSLMEQPREAPPILPGVVTVTPIGDSPSFGTDSRK